MNVLRAIHRKLCWETDAGSAQMLIYGIALLIMVVGIRKVASMELPESQLIFGIVLVLILTVQAILVGTVVGLCARKP